MFNTWFVNKVNYFVIAGSINFRSLVKTSSNPQLFLLGRLFIVFLVVFLSTYLKVKPVLIRLFS